MPGLLPTLAASNYNMVGGLASSVLSGGGTPPRSKSCRQAKALMARAGGRGLLYEVKVTHMPDGARRPPGDGWSVPIAPYALPYAYAGC